MAEEGKADQNPLVKGKIRSGRDDNRPTEDDIAKRRLGDCARTCRRCFNRQPTRLLPCAAYLNGMLREAPRF